MVLLSLIRIFAGRIENKGITIKSKNKMDIKTTTFTEQDWAEHEQFVSIFRAAKQRKREWQAKMETLLSEKATKMRKRREEIDALFD